VGWLKVKALNSSPSTAKKNKKSKADLKRKNARHICCGILMDNEIREYYSKKKQLHENDLKQILLTLLFSLVYFCKTRHFS
jgi:hypothetical protein